MACGGVTGAKPRPGGRKLRVLFVSNGHGEDDIACKILDALHAQIGGAISLAAWPMVGHGKAFQNRDVEVIGPPNHLPSEGFGTVSLGLFLRDVWAGFIGTYLRQVQFARSLAGQFDLLVGVGDIVPLAVSKFSGIPICFTSCAKSAHYGGRDGHNGLERALMRAQNCLAVFPRDHLTAERLAPAIPKVHDLGNPMMDGLAAVELPAIKGTGKVNLAVLAGSRGDATVNTQVLLDAIPRIATNAPDPTALRFLFAAHPAVDFTAIATAMVGREGWQKDDWDQPLTAAGWLCFLHQSGAKALLVTTRFADILQAADLAIGMAGTANEQAIGLGIPLIALPGTGNQGEGFQKMKMAYFGPSAMACPLKPGPIAEAVAHILSDPELAAIMGQAGRDRMGSPGASEAIAKAIAAALTRIGSQQ